MKNAISIILILLFPVCTYAQQGINYKAVIKDGGGTILSSSSVSIQFIIYEGAALTNNVYQESHILNSDANGLIIVNIGEGTPASGVFADIDWGSDAHFLNTQIDTGAGLVDMGTTQFMAVPYAKTAERVSTFDYYYADVDEDGYGDKWQVIYSPNPPTGFLTDNTDCNDSDNLVWEPQTYYVDADGDGYGSTTSALFCESSPPSGYSDNATDCDDTEATTYPGAQEIANDGIDNDCDDQIDEINTDVANIGDLRDGAVVFWVDPDDNTQGLACAINDQSSVSWTNNVLPFVFIDGTLDGIGAGSANTDIIVAVEGPADTYAAGKARAYTGGGFNDWFLPSTDELNEMFLNRVAINATATANGGTTLASNWYWSSKEVGGMNAKQQHLFSGEQRVYNKGTAARVRAVRAFPPPASIGDLRADGVVFWVDPTDNTHGLVCSLVDQSPGIQWFNGSNVITNATGITVGTGSVNTDAIIAVQGPVESDYAAGLARAYTGGGFNDWFLPNKDELNQMYLNRAAIDATSTSNGGVAFQTNSFYWSSTELQIDASWLQNFGDGNQLFSAKSGVYLVRAVRAF